MLLDRIEFDLLLEVHTPLTVGNGRLEQKSGSDGGSVLDIHRGDGGHPCVPASTLKGALAARWRGDPEAGDAVFGLVDDRDQGTAGRLLLQAALYDKRSRPKGETTSDASDDPHVDRPVTAIDRERGAAERGKLFTMRAVKRGVRFRLRGKLMGDYGPTLDAARRQRELALAAQALRPLAEGLPLGRGTRIGLGRLRLDPDGTRIGLHHCRPDTGFVEEDVTAAFFAAWRTAAAAVGEAPAAYRLQLEARTPYISVDPGASTRDGKGNVLRCVLSPEKTPLLWASSLVGALRARAAWLAELARLRHPGASRFVPAGRADRHPADDRFLREGLDGRRAVTSPSDLAKLSSVERLFGVPGWKGLLHVEPPRCTARGEKRKFASTAIDRLTGGGRDGALFEVVARDGCRFETALRIDGEGRHVPSNLLADDEALLEALVADLAAEGVMLGHGAARGFGWFAVGVDGSPRPATDLGRSAARPVTAARASAVPQLDRQQLADFNGSHPVVKAPYAFVDPGKPMARRSKLGGPGHGRPLPDGLSGRLAVEWTFDQPVLVGGAENNSVFAQKDGLPTLPGATLRGLVRTLVEIASNSRMEVFDRDAHHAVRDFTDRLRWRRFVPGPDDGDRIDCGWLRRCGKAPASEKAYDGWEIAVVVGQVIRTQDYLRATDTPTDQLPLAAFEALTVGRKYEVIAARGGAFVDASKRIRWRGRNPAAGWLVVNGIDPNLDNDPDQPPYPKLTSVLFGQVRHGWLPVHPGVVRRFIRTHGTNARAGHRRDHRGAWDFWLDSYEDLPAAASGTRMPGIPVFIVRASARDDLATVLAEPSGPRAVYLGLSRLWKVPAAYGADDVLERSGHRAAMPLDFARALFGHVPPEKLDPAALEGSDREALKGRVFFAEAALVPDAPIATHTVEGAVTMSPRASFWPYYLRPGPGDAGGEPYDYSNQHALIAGWKRYPVRGGQPQAFPVPPPRPAAAGAAPEPAASVSTMHFLQASSQRPRTFRGEIRFHNLAPAELGALLWAITWGAPDGLDGRACAERHLVGRGKAQGYGRCRARIAGHAITANAAGAAPEPSALVRAFETEIAEAYAEATGRPKVAFADLPFIRRLRALADPQVGSHLSARLAYPSAQAPNPESSATIEGYKRIKHAAKRGDGAGRSILPPYPMKDPERR